MSKESKPADLWRHVFAAAADRPADWCKGCGYFVVAHGSHRADCLLEQPDAARRNSEPDPTDAEAVETVKSILGGRVIGTKGAAP